MKRRVPFRAVWDNALHSAYYTQQETWKVWVSEKQCAFGLGLYEKYVPAGRFPTTGEGAAISYLCRKVRGSVSERLFWNLCKLPLFVFVLDALREMFGREDYSPPEYY